MIIDGTTYDDSVPESLARALEHHRRMERGTGSRLLFVYAGFSVRGYVGRSTGSVKVPLVVHNRRSRGGDLLSPERLVEVRKSRGDAAVWVPSKI
jgi:hypothetical protein